MSIGAVALGARPAVHTTLSIPGQSLQIEPGISVYIPLYILAQTGHLAD